MTVVYQNNFYTLDMSYFLFQSLKRTDPDLEVDLLSFIDSSYYAEPSKAKISDIEDWSVVRNIQALSN